MASARYTMLDIELALEAPDELVAFFDSLYGRFREVCTCAVCRAADRHPVKIAIAPTSDGTTSISVNGVIWTVPPDLAPSTLFFLIQNHVVGQVREFFCIHGAASVIAGKGCVVVAASATGKTTLSLELLARGHGFLSDEVAAVHVRSALLHAYPRNLAVRGGSLGLTDGPRPPVLRKAQIAGEEKSVVDAGWNGAVVPNPPVTPDVVILLDRPADETVSVADGNAVLELYPSIEGEGFLAALTELPSVQEVVRMESPLSGVRVVHTRGIPLMSRINEVSEQTGTVLMGHHRGASLPIDYDESPVMKPLSAREGVLKLLPSVLNGSPAAGGTGEWVFALSRILGNTRFYRMIPGRLGETADLVEMVCEHG